MKHNRKWLRASSRIGCAVLWLTNAKPGQAQDWAFPAPRALALRAHPNAPDVSMIWRGSLRGTIALNVPVIGTPYVDPFSLNVLPLAEIHNEPGSTAPLPSHNSRGRLSIYGAWAWHYATLVQLGVEHESDHYTARPGAPDGFLELNDVFAVGSHTWATNDWSVTARASLALYIWSCTEIDSPCRDFHGATTGGGEAGLVWDFRGQDPEGFAPFVALSLDGILGHDEVSREGRVVLHLGVWSLAGQGGLWQLFGLGYYGHDVGILRSERLTQVGLGVRYAP